MDGWQQTLIDSYKGCFDGVRRIDAAKAIVTNLLGDQFVHHDGETYRVVRGSGMGSSHSSKLSSFTFFDKVERDVVSNTAVRRRYGLVSWIRYEDDVFAIFLDNVRKVRAFVDDCNERSVLTPARQA